MHNYLKSHVFFIVSFVLLASGVNFLIDPYSVFEVFRARGINHNKPFQANRERVFKPLRFYHLQPEIVITGSSVIQYGVDPVQVESTTGQSAFNFGIDGPNIYELRKIVEFSIRNGNPKVVIFGIELLTFHGARGKEIGLFSSRRMNLDLADERFLFLEPKEVVQFLASIRVLVDSFKTITQQSAIPYYTEAGFIQVPYKQREIFDYPEIFGQTTDAYIGLLRNLSFNYKDGESVWDEFRILVQMAYQNQIELLLFYSPMHQHFYKQMEREGLVLHFEAMKTQLAQILEEEAQKAQQSPFVIKDYSVLPLENQEAFPALEVGQRMEFWYDSYHYTPKYGKRILEELLSASTSYRSEKI